MAFLKEPEPERGLASNVCDGLLRVVARNSGIMTYHGTNTYLLEEEEGFMVIDPGPREDIRHVDEVIAAAEGRITRYVITHGHHDHVGALPEMLARVRAPVHSFVRPLNEEQVPPDVPIKDGDRVGPLTAVHTPGHAPDHLCFACRGGILFSGDHVMGWSSSVVSPPSGDMAHYVASLELLLGRADTVYLPGHGPALPEPHLYVRELRARRVRREKEILNAIRVAPSGTRALSRALYDKTDPHLQDAAERNVMSHLAKLRFEGRAEEHDGLWRPTSAAPE